MTIRTMIAMIGVAGAASSTLAEATWDGRVGFARTTSGPILVGNTFQLTATGTYTFVVRTGIFEFTSNVPGESNQGVAHWGATVNATGFQPGETLGVTPATARLSPFGTGPATQLGGTLVNPSRIEGILCARDTQGSAQAPWFFDEPMPTAPTTLGPVGVESLTNVWRFTVHVTTLSGADIPIVFTGDSVPIAKWVPGNVAPPEDEATPGSVGFFGFRPLTPWPSFQYPPTTLTLVRVPAPGGAAALLCGVVATGVRRRRSGERG